MTRSWRDPYNTADFAPYDFMRQLRAAGWKFFKQPNWVGFRETGVKNRTPAEYAVPRFDGRV